MKVYVIKHKKGDIHSIYGEDARRSFDYAVDALDELEAEYPGEYELSTIELATDLTTDGCRCTLCGSRPW